MAAKTKAKGLGKGLEALFGDAEVAPVEKKQATGKKQTAGKTEESPSEESGVLYVSIDDIKPNTTQPRKNFDEEKLEELAASIERHGVIQPLVLRKLGKGYEIVAGERRWRAARIAGLKEVPCIVKELTDEENMLLAIIENMQREDLNPIEEAEGIRQMIDTYGLTQEQITTGHARALAGIKSRQLQVDLAMRAAKEDLSVRQIENLVKAAKEPPKKPAARTPKTADEKRVEEDLKNALGTRVRLNRKGKKGKIEIEFYSTEELERLIELLKTLG